MLNTGCTLFLILATRGWGFGTIHSQMGKLTGPREKSIPLIQRPRFLPVSQGGGWNHHDCVKPKSRKQLSGFKGPNALCWFERECLPKARNPWSPVRRLLRGGCETVRGWHLDVTGGGLLVFVAMSHFLFLCLSLSVEGMSSQLPAPAAPTLPYHANLFFRHLSRS